MTQNQVLPIECEYFTTKLLTDLPIIVCSVSPSTLNSNGGRFLQTRIGRASCDDMQSDPNELPEDQAKNFRQYLAFLRILDVNMDPEAAKVAENEFVTRRQDPSTASSAAFTVEDFHSWLVIARLLAKSYGLETVTTDIWKMAMELERSRKKLLHTTTE